MRKKYERSCKTKAFLGVDFADRVNLLPYGDMVKILNKLLEFPQEKVHEIAANGEAPSFIYACAKLLDDNRLCEYMETFKICQEMNEKEQRKKQTDM